MPRQIAVEVLQRVEQDDAYSHIALASALEKRRLDARDRSLATELVYGTLTWQRTLDTLIERFTRRPVKKLDLPVVINLRLALYQILFLDRIPAHAAVDEAVNLTKRAAGKGAGNFVNGVLRNMLRQRDRLVAYKEADRDKKPARYLGERYSLPNWIANRLLQAHGIDRAEGLAEAFNRRPTLCLRTMDLSTPAELPEGVEPVEGVPGALRAEGFTDAVREEVEAYRLAVQDLGSQLICRFTGVTGGQRVLDAAAGLGGKTLYLAALAGPGGHVDAVEPAGGKIELMRKALDATGLAERVAVHATTLQDFAATGPDAYDAVLLDAPCTGLGTMRRHPETRWRRTEGDVGRLARLQTELLDAAAPLVRPGGTLTYSVCTFAHEEGPQQVEAFLGRHPDFERVAPPEGLDWSRYTDDRGDLSLNPLDHDTDAFYAARLRRKG